MSLASSFRSQQGQNRQAALPNQRQRLSKSLGVGTIMQKLNTRMAFELFLHTMSRPAHTPKHPFGVLPLFGSRTWPLKSFVLHPGIPGTLVWGGRLPHAHTQEAPAAGCHGALYFGGDHDGRGHRNCNGVLPAAQLSVERAASLHAHHARRLDDCCTPLRSIRGCLKEFWPRVLYT